MVNFANVDRLRLELEAMLREHPELTDDEQLRVDMLDGETDITDVMMKLVTLLGRNKALGQGLHHYIEELEQREERYEQRQEFLRDLIFRVMDSAQIKKMELPQATLSLRANPPRLVGDADAATLPDNLCTIKRTVDRTAVKAQIEAGRAIEGFALSNAAPSLNIRVK